MTEVSHIVIRDPSYVSGTSKKPEVGVFVQTHTRMRPLKEDKLNNGQAVWMKWNDGPIVAKSKILSWHTGRFCGGNVNAIRELCIGTKLFGLGTYWKSVSDKFSGFFAVILLTDEEWLEKPIFSAARSYGHSWIYLDNPEKTKSWLDHVPDRENKDQQSGGRALPISFLNNTFSTPDVKTR